MRALFTIGDAYLPQVYGGAQSSTHQLATELERRGHQAGILSYLKIGGWTEYRSRIVNLVRGTEFARDTRLGYPVYRSWRPTDLGEVVSRFRPDVVVVQERTSNSTHVAQTFEALGLPVVVYFRNVELDEVGGDPSALQRARFIANSRFTAARYEQRFGVRSTVIPPLVERAQYETASTRENVTFINPYPEKGVDLAIEIARLCPDIPFSFVESWALEGEYREALLKRLETLPNVTLRGKTMDMKSVYGRARLLLAPSRWEEAWGRVATEAQCSGIPVIGSRRGGLPEAIGPAGLVLDFDAPASEWAAAVQRLWDDEREYDRLSAAARSYADRDEMRPDKQFDAFLAVLEDAIGKSAASPERIVA